MDGLGIYIQQLAKAKNWPNYRLDFGQLELNGTTTNTVNVGNQVRVYYNANLSLLLTDYQHPGLFIPQLQIAGSNQTKTVKLVNAGSYYDLRAWTTSPQNRIYQVMQYQPVIGAFEGNTAIRIVAPIPNSPQVPSPKELLISYVDIYPN